MERWQGERFELARRMFRSDSAREVSREEELGRIAICAKANFPISELKTCGQIVRGEIFMSIPTHDGSNICRKLAVDAGATLLCQSDPNCRQSDPKTT